MSKKIEFIQACMNKGIAADNAEKAWEKVQSLIIKINSNWEYFKKLREKTPIERLYLRQTAAEMGTEWTPKEVDELINIIGTIQDQIKHEKN